MKKPAILLYTPRSGSHWVLRYMRKYNEENFNFFYIDHPQHGGELFNKTLTYLEKRIYNTEKNTLIVNRKRSVDSWDKKVSFLTKERKKGVNYSYKTKIEDIQDIDWFREFYKDYDIIKLKRRNLWNQFVSYVIQDHNNWNHSYKPKYYNSFLVDEKRITQWLNTHKKYDNIILETEILYYELLTDEVLSRRFQINLHEDTETTAKLVNHRKQSYQNIILNYDKTKECFYKIASDMNVKTI